MSWQGQWAGHSVGRWYGYGAAVVEPEPETPFVPSGGFSWMPPIRRKRPPLDEIDEEDVFIFTATRQ